MIEEVRVVRVMKPVIPRHLFVASSAWASRIIMALAQLASIRVLMSGLGLEQYAIFALLTGLSGWFTLADLGVGSSLQNYISEQRAKAECDDAYVIAAAALAAVLFCFLIVILYFSSAYIAPILLKRYPLLRNSDKARLFFITSLMFVVSTLGGISYRIWYAEQKGYLANMLAAVASLLGYAGISIVNRFEISNRLLLSVAAFIVPSAVLPLVSFSVQIGGRLKNGFHQLDWNIIVKVIKRASPFWAFALMANLVLQIDYIIMSQLLKSEDIVAYNLSTKIFGLALFIYVSVLTALWPVFSEAIAKGNWAMVRSHTGRYLGIGLGFMSASTTLLVWLMPRGIQFLAPNETVVIPITFILLLGVYQLLRVWTDTFAMILLSMSDLRPLWIISPLQALVSVISQWYLAQLFGLYGIVLGLILSFVLTASWALPFAVHKHYRKYTVI